MNGNIKLSLIKAVGSTWESNKELLPEIRNFFL